jgi:hypothetical protein
MARVLKVEARASPPFGCAFKAVWEADAEQRLQPYALVGPRLQGSRRQGPAGAWQPVEVASFG